MAKNFPMRQSWTILSGATNPLRVCRQQKDSTRKNSEMGRAEFTESGLVRIDDRKVFLADVSLKTICFGMTCLPANGS